MSGLLFAFSTWTILTAQNLSTSSLLLLVVPALLLAGELFQHEKYDKWLPLTSFLAAMCLYVPYVWLLVLVGVITIFSDLRDVWLKSAAKFRLIWSLCFFVPLLPLVYGLTKVEILKVLVGVPKKGIGLSSFINNIADLPGQLFINGVSGQSHWLSGTPIIDFATAAFFIIGIIYTFINKLHPRRRNILLLFLFFILMSVGFSGAEYITFLITMIYVYAALGIGFMLQRWMAVFPNNSFARSFGVVVMTGLIAVSIGYNVFRYHNAWPNAQVKHGQTNEVSSIYSPEIIQPKFAKI
jgi:hypothetical protein